MKARELTATEFKARCLALLDEVADHGKAITITKRGRPVALLGPAKKTARKSPRGAWVGKVQVVGDIVNADDSKFWVSRNDRNIGTALGVGKPTKAG